jgi:hypothetical protein
MGVGGAHDCPGSWQIATEIGSDGYGLCAVCGQGVRVTRTICKGRPAGRLFRHHRTKLSRFRDRLAAARTDHASPAYRMTQFVLAQRD